MTFEEKAAKKDISAFFAEISFLHTVYILVRAC